jgi:cytochrome c
MPILTALRARIAVSGPNARLPRVPGLFLACFVMMSAAGGARADLIGHGGMVRAVDVSPDGQWVITASFDFTARLWDFGAQAEVAVLDAHEGPVTSAVFAPDGKHAVTTSDDKTAIIWDVPSGKLVRRLTGHGHKVMAAAFSPDGRQVATGSWDKTLRIWNMTTGKTVRVIEHAAPINDVAFVNGGAWIAAGGHDGKVGMWSIANGRLQGVLEGHRQGITKMNALPGGARLLTASIDRSLRLWDVKTGKTVSVLTHGEDRTGQVYAAAVSPDGRRALSAGRDGRLVEWDLATGDVLKTIPAHDKIVWAARFTPDGRFALTASADETTAVWHLETGDRIGLRASDKKGKQPWLSSDHPGARLFTKCANCHALNAQAAMRSGPHFEGLWGRTVGAVAGYNYSGALRNKSFTWNEKTLFDLFDKGPDKFLPGTKMPVQRVPDKEQLANLVDYLRVLTGAAKP